MATRTLAWQQGRTLMDSQQLQQWRATVETIMQGANGTSWAVLWRDLMSLGGEAAAEAATGQNLTEPSALMDCINSEYVAQDMTWEHNMQQKLGSLKAVAAWWNNRLPSLPLTLVTSGSMTRLQQVAAQCLSWNGPLSVVLYQPLYQKPTPDGKLTEANLALLRQAVLQIAQFVADMHKLNTTCRPEVTLTYEVFSEESARDLLYPANTLRNLARLQARTPLIAQLDIDLLVSRSLHDRMMRLGTVLNMMRQTSEHKVVFIIPAFDVKGQLHERAAWADALVTAQKEMVVEAWKQQILFQFADNYKQAHRMTDYSYWLAAGEDYVVPYQEDAEPWLLTSRTSVPWHDERYRGYGLNKQQMVAAVNATGHMFKVLHNVFTIHRAHKKSDQRAVLLEGVFRAGVPPVFFHNQNLYNSQKHYQKLGQPFNPPLTPAVVKCQSTLPWWQLRHIQMGNTQAPLAATNTTDNQQVQPTSTQK